MVIDLIPKSVLLVEDNDDDSFIAIRTLRKIGIATITVATDGQKALDMLFTSGEPLPDLLVLDLKLPKVGGLKVLEEIRRQERTMYLPVLVLTSSSDPKDIETCRDLGVLTYLTKPLILGKLQQVFS